MNEPGVSAAAPPRKATNPFALIVMLIGILYLLALIIPSGQYVRVNGVVDPNTFHFVRKVFLSPLLVLQQMPIEAWKDMGKLFITMMVVGGTLRVIQDTDTLDIGLYAITDKFKDRVLLLVPILYAFTGFLGTASVLLNTSIAFIPLGLTIARRLKVDNAFGVAIIILGSFTGHMASPISPVGTVIAQELAHVPVFSGFNFRLYLTITFLAVLSLYMLIYAYRVRQDPRHSVMDAVDLESMDMADMSGRRFTLRHAMIMALFVLSFGLFAYGSTRYSFGVADLASIMFPVAIACGAIGGLGVDGLTKSFIKGAQGMVMPIIFMVLASSITVILQFGGIMDTVVYYVSIPLASLGPVLAALGMAVANAVICIIIPSASGHAVVVTPIMAPLADVVGITRQTAVLAYQLGHALIILINPFNVILIACLTTGRVQLREWLKLALPLTGIFTVISAVALALAVTIGWH